ncbi:hypothetical protein KSP40_PGU004079 [Platanthera guangdongensis]|uniref:U6 small nuclear RNA (adenine-(43)-N(6))-methyltransferase n=1 Tax=Platanthera guangdongensis TaxID=2320717 RepID=A0ABR2LXY7_9ASPA
MLSRKRRREQPPAIHPCNRYAENPPDFAQLASLYPSFEPFVFPSRSGRPTIDWKDFNATRELTRVLLLNDHGVNWWIPDGQLCPTVPNRSNYIHWINDLLSSELIPSMQGSNARIRGFDIGTGANCIYPLLGAALLGWSFVGSDVAVVALEWAKRNVESNPHLLELIEIRDASDQFSCGYFMSSASDNVNEDHQELLDIKKSGTLPVLAGVVKDGEIFEFCMCNPPFFESIEEAGLNPKTSCEGTPEEMVYPGGERAFITRIIEDSVGLRHSFRWFTTMVGRKANLKSLISKLREVGVSIVKTTEFVQGHTTRWGLAWSFIPPSKTFISSNTPLKSRSSFTLEVYQSCFFGIDGLIAASFVLCSHPHGLKLNLGCVLINVTISGFSCKSDLLSFSIRVNISLENGVDLLKVAEKQSSNTPTESQCAFCVSVLEQIPGTVLVRWSSVTKDTPVSGSQYSSSFQEIYLM